MNGSTFCNLFADQLLPVSSTFALGQRTVSGTGSKADGQKRSVQLTGKGRRLDNLRHRGGRPVEFANRNLGFTKSIVGEHDRLPAPHRGVEIGPNPDLKLGW